MPVEPEHRSILAVDIEAFSDQARTNPIRLELHQYLNRLLPDLLVQVGVPAEQYATGDTGDGLVISVASQTSTVRLVDPLVPRLARRLAEFNRDKPPSRRMRLRVAVHAGGVLADPEPLHGEAVVHTCRLLDSPAARACLKATEQDLVAIVSQTVYDDVVKHAFGRIDPTAWHRVVAELKETRAPAWAHVPGDEDAPLRTAFVTSSPDDRSGPLPRQLPARLAEFTGREKELAHLGEVLASVAAGGPAVVITAIDGLGGIGKSALAIEAARQLANRFPDGQLYLDLQGSTPGLEPLTPLYALSCLLRSLGGEPRDIPTEVEEAAAYYRTLTSDRRLLLLLDNAHDAAQVRPLLPGHPGCAVVITSRETLAFLEGATRLPLDALSESEALELLGRLAGRGRVEAEPAAAARLIELCGRLPLALQITGRRLASRPAWSLADHADRLADQQQRLDQLSFGDRAVRGSFELSYQLLTDHEPRAARALRLLSLLDCPDVSVPVAAVLLETSAKGARTLLERLVDASLLSAPPPHRYWFHDLMRLFAREHAARQHPPAERVAALTRAFGFYAAMVWHTVGLLRPGDYRLDIADLRGTASEPQFPDAPAALAWLETERTNLIAAIQQAATSEIPTLSSLAGELVSALSGFFDTRNHWQDWIRANQTVLELGCRTGDRVLEARAGNDLGFVYRRVGRYAEAIEHHQASLAIYRDLGDRRGEAYSLLGVGLSHEYLGRYEDAIELHQASLRRYRGLGDRHGEAHCLNSLGVAYRRWGRYDDAVDCHRASLAIHRDLGDRRGAAYSLNDLGVVYEGLGRYEEAIECNRASITIRQELGDRRGEAYCLSSLGVAYSRLGRYSEAIAHHEASLASFRGLNDRRGEVIALRQFGDTLHAAGRTTEARAAWREALDVSESLGIPEADEIRARLADLSS